MEEEVIRLVMVMGGDVAGDVELVGEVAVEASTETDKLGDSLKTVADEQENVSETADEAADALKKEGDEAQKAAKKTDAKAVSLKGLGAAAGATIAVIAVLATGFVKLGQAAADSVNDLNDMSVRTAISTELLAGLQLAAEGSGQSLQQLEPALAEIVKQMARTGDTTRTADEVLRENLKTLIAIKDPTERAAKATELFGRNGTKLLQALGNPAALDHFVDQARVFGVDVGPKASAAAADWQRAMADLSLVTDSIPQDLIEKIFGEDASTVLDAFVLQLVVVKGVLDGVADAFKGKYTSMEDILKEAMARAQEFAQMTDQTRRAASGGTADEDFPIYGPPAPEQEPVSAGLPMSFASADTTAADEAAAEKAAEEARAAALLESFNEQIEGATVGAGEFTDESRAAAKQLSEDLAVESKGFFQRAFGEVQGFIRSSAGQAAGGLMQGNTSALFAATGPVGAILGFLEGVGGAGGAKGVEEKLDETGENIVKGLVALPEIAANLMTQGLPKFIGAFLKAFWIGLPKAFAEAWVQIFQDVKDFLNPFSRQGENDDRGFLERVGDVFRDSQNTNSRTRARGSGGVGPGSGMRGAFERQPLLRGGLAGAMRGGPAMVINTLAVDGDLENRIARQLGQMQQTVGGRGLSTAPVGA